MVFLQTGSLDFCPNHRPLTPSPLLFMIGMGIRRIVRLLLWRCLTFDTVPHGPLLLKLGAVGLSGPIHSWFRSYLSDRSQLGVISTKKDPFPDMILQINNQPIERVSSAKFLGILITQNIS